MDSRNLACTYVIRCEANGETYHGSTKDWYVRKAVHKSQLFHKKHYSKRLQDDWVLYGERAFTFEVLEILNGATKDELQAKEQLLLDEKRATTGLSYNNTGCARFQDALQEASQKPHPSFINKRTGEIIPAGVNLRRLCKERGLDNGAMWRVLKGKDKSHKGWRLLEVVRKANG